MKPVTIGLSYFEKYKIMQTLINKYFWFSSFIIALILSVSCNERKENPSNPGDTTNLSSETMAVDTSFIIPVVERESITFILGEDKNTVNPYYAEATRYFSSNNDEHTTYLVTSCRSISEVRQYLVEHAPVNKLPWGRINLVSHGDQWLGLSVKVTPETRRSTQERLEEYLQSPTFSPLPDNLIDFDTEIAVRACGIGNNPEWVETLASVFRSEHAIPQLIAPRLFEFYESNPGNNGEPLSCHYMANVWMVSFRKDEVPGNIGICNLLHNKYPNEHIDWQDALSRTNPRFGGDTYHYTFDIPVNMVINLAATDSLPDFKSTENKLRWLNQQPQILHILSKIQIPAESFSWDLKKGFSKNSNGKRIVAISVKGYCTMLCILRPLIDEKATTAGNIKPFVPELTDTAFYYLSKGKAFTIKS